MKIRIRRSRPDIPMPSYNPATAAAFDIAVSEDRTVPPGKISLIGTGLFIEVPEGYFLGVFSRSSTPLRLGLSIPHGVGVLDPTYSGPKDELLIQVFNHTDKPVEVKKGDRLAQGILMQSPRIEFEETGNLAETSRGGFGSTGH